MNISSKSTDWFVPLSMTGHTTCLPLFGISEVDRIAFIGFVIGVVFMFFLSWRSASKRTAEKSASDSQSLSKTATFSVLKNRRRRNALQYLHDAGGEANLSDLAEYIAAKENDIETDQLTSAQRKRVYTALHQSHLPMMDEEGVIEYNRQRGRVELLDAASELFEYVEDTTRTDVTLRYVIGCHRIVLQFSVDRLQ